MNTRIKDFTMTNTILPRAATLAATLCAALALSTPAFALDVQIQEGAAVKFPKGLKWEPMVKTETFRGNGKIKSLPAGASSKKEQALALSVWKKELSLPVTHNDRPNSIISKLIKSDKIFYFVTAPFNPGFDDIIHGNAKIIVSHDEKFASPTVIDAGSICVTTGADDEDSGIDYPYEVLHQEIAFDANVNTIYMRQRFDKQFPQECNRKITLTPGDKTSGGAAQNATTPAPASQSQSGAAIAGDITPRRALEALYGSVSTANTPDRDCKEYASWKPPLNTEKFKNYFSMGEQYKNQPLLVCNKFSATYTEQDKQKFVLVTRAGIRAAFDTVNFSTTDVPPPIIGMAVFVKDGGQWRLEVEDRFAAYTGFSETMKLQKVGANKYGVLLTDVSHYGAGCDNVEVKLLMPHAGGVTAHELNVPLTEKEEMSFSECKATSVSFDTKSRDEHYPVTVKQTFTDERGRNLKKSARLTFSNGSYVKSK